MQRGNLHEQAGAPPIPYDGRPTHKDMVADTSNVTFHRPGRGAEGHRTSANRSNSGFNLRGVCEVLEEFGLDPVAELARVLKEQKPVLDHEGQQRKNADGTDMTQHALAIDLRTRVLTELTNFVHPKLKAVEMTIKKPELTEEQVEARLVELLSRAAKKSLD